MSDSDAGSYNGFDDGDFQEDAWDSSEKSEDRSDSDSDIDIPPLEDAGDAYYHGTGDLGPDAESGNRAGNAAVSDAATGVIADAIEARAAAREGKSRPSAPPPKPRVREGQRILITNPQDRVTRLEMSKFEFTRLVAERAKHIEDGADDIDPAVVERCRELGLTDALDIAAVELESVSHHFPMKVLRPMGGGVFEVWGARELRLPSQVLRESFSPEATATLHHTALEMSAPPDDAPPRLPDGIAVKRGVAAGVKR